VRSAAAAAAAVLQVINEKPWLGYIGTIMVQTFQQFFED
jgi:hypothetical protein